MERCVLNKKVLLNWENEDCWRSIFAEFEEHLLRERYRMVRVVLRSRAASTGVVSHAGLVLLRELADRTGLTAGLSAALPSPAGGHDRGRVFADLACAIADGGPGDQRFPGNGRPAGGLRPGRVGPDGVAGAEGGRGWRGPGPVSMLPEIVSKSACSFDCTSATKRALASSCSSLAFSFCSRAICASRGSVAGRPGARPGAAGAPASRARRHSVIRLEYRPSRRRIAPFSPFAAPRKRPGPPACTAR